MQRKLSITIVGPGSLGGALAETLHRFRYTIDEIVYRGDPKRAKEIGRRSGAKAISFQDASFDSTLVWICVGDADIKTTAQALRKRMNCKGKVVFHSSGASSSDELATLRKAGASVASVHPMMSFVRSAEPSFVGVPFALEGDAAAVMLAGAISKQLGGKSFPLKKKDKPLYHALGAFSSPLLISQLAAAERIGRKLGLKPEQTRNVIAPIVLKSIRNYFEHGPAKAFSGPIRRGDVETIARNLVALKRVRGTAEIYRALARIAVDDLPAENRKQIKKLLAKA
jgi:predicted short-subunit dehydrogenase-like oxidoreductase (DUF2520 family)